ncbi:hypothetical protein [Dyadobacter sandarakinus]|uniref:YD repeat-containing protein n=1 Tax=Dyadobacter sandarakinus TaxID=2747268 RepID=A0ABX7I9I2_9BACT|nr:hypothetical protein [Dyadobacter sandarakinus]QRR02383.1 hypothetical protein HWI92_16435 [Dyadobacter sandarakinus]
MQHYSFRSIFKWTIIFLFNTSTFFSCTTEDHPEAAACRYTGFQRTENNGDGSAKQQSYKSVKLDEEGKLAEAEYGITYTFSDNNSQAGDVSSGNVQKYVMNYDGDDFLKTATHTAFQSNKNKRRFSRGDFGPYYEISVETVSTTSFVYEAGKVVSSSTKIVETLIGDKVNKKVTESESSKVWKYSGGTLASTIETTSSGGVYTTAFAADGGYTRSNATGSDVTIYDPVSRTRTIKLIPFAEYTIVSDANGNEVFVRTVNASNVYTDTFKYDQQKNPDWLIPKDFKGIPEPIITIQTSAGQNNLQEINSVSTIGGSEQRYNTKVSYTFNSSGYPTGDTWQSLSSSGFVRTTSYMYENCP